MPVHPLDGAFERVNRAQEHFAELQHYISIFGQFQLDTSAIHFDPNPPYEVKVFAPVSFSSPSAIVSVVLGELIYNLRSALDYLIFELARHDSRVIQHGTQFPIDDKPKKFAEHIPTRLKGLSGAHIAAIERLQPYNGCNWTKLLRDLSNPDKHRELTARGASFSVTVMGPGAMLPGGGNCRTIRKAQRPDGIEMEVELVGTIQIIIPVGTHPTLGVFGDAIEIVTDRLISEVRNLLEALKPEF
jgi:hypothetical protein